MTESLATGTYEVLRNRLREAEYQVHSFDHVAVSDDVIVCDVGQGVPLGDGELTLSSSLCL